MDVTTVTPALATAIVLYIAGTVTYRLYFHPLAKFPGPKLAAATRWYEAYYDVVCRGRYTFKIAELHKKYGPIIRISPHELHVSDATFYEYLYRQDGRWNKYSWAYDAFGVKQSTICTADHYLHRQRRGPLNPFFSKRNILKNEHIIQAKTNKLCQRISEFASRSSSLDLGAAVSAFARDVALEYLLGKSYGNLDAKDFNAAMATIFQNGGIVWQITKHVRWYGPLLQSIPLSFLENMGDAGTRSFFSYTRDIMELVKSIMASISDYKPRNSKPPTLVHAILQSDLPASEKTFERVNDDISTITGAAFETTAQVLRVTLYYIYSNRDILDQLRSELKATGLNKGNAPLSWATLENLSYLTAVLMEGLRLMPGICTRLARIAPDRGLLYKEWQIPAGTPVGMTTLLMHLDENLYPEPKSFRPERWLDAEARRQADGTYAPFSRGTRICMGTYLAWAELYIATATIVRRFDFTFAPGMHENIEPYSDSFIITTKRQTGFEATVKEAV